MPASLARQNIAPLITLHAGQHRPSPTNATPLGSPEARGRDERFRPIRRCGYRDERALHVTLVTFQGLQPELEIHELPQEHHVILTDGAGGDDLVVFLHEPENLFDVVDASLLEGA